MAEKILSETEISHARFLASCEEPTFRGQGYTIGLLCEEVARIVKAKYQEHEVSAVAAERARIFQEIEDKVNSPCLYRDECNFNYRCSEHLLHRTDCKLWQALKSQPAGGK